MRKFRVSWVVIVGKYDLSYTLVRLTTGARYAVRTARLFFALAQDPATGTLIAAKFPFGASGREELEKFRDLLGSDETCARRLSVLLPAIIEDELVEQSLVTGVVALDKKLNKQRVSVEEQMGLDALAATAEAYVELIVDVKEAAAAERREAK